MLLLILAALPGSTHNSKLTTAGLIHHQKPSLISFDQQSAILKTHSCVYSHWCMNFTEHNFTSIGSSMWMQDFSISSLSPLPHCYGCLHASGYIGVWCCVSQELWCCLHLRLLLPFHPHTLMPCACSHGDMSLVFKHLSIEEPTGCWYPSHLTHTCTHTHTYHTHHTLNLRGKQ